MGNIKVDVIGTNTQSVIIKFGTDSDSMKQITDNAVPFSLGDLDGDYEHWVPEIGVSYIISVQACSLKRGDGECGRRITSMMTITSGEDISSSKTSATRIPIICVTFVFFGFGI